MRKSWVIGNWKLNPDFERAKQLLQACCAEQMAPVACQVAYAVPMPYAVWATQSYPQHCIGVQDVSVMQDYGAYTGEVNAQLLHSCGVKLVLVGHSERRQCFADDVQKVQTKVKNALSAGLTVVYCVGESLAERELGQAENVVLGQIQDLIDVVSPQQWQQVVIAYEPIWAIGTGQTASAEDAQCMHASIRQYLQKNQIESEKIAILYGGSVKAENASQFSQCPDVDGALVGGASLDAQSFQAIINAFA